MQPQSPQALPPMPAAQPPAVSQPTNLPTTADDTDSIEPVWVEQAKRVISSNAGDPYKQNQEFTKLKVDYMQKRYGKAVKTEE